jgi:hypothetical protein
VFELVEEDNQLFRALSEYDLLDIADVVSLPFEHIGNLTYIDDQGNERKLVLGCKSLLHCFKSYYLHRRAQGNPIGDKWTDITYEDLTVFRIGPDYPLATPPTPTTLTPPLTRQRTRDPIVERKKSIKRDSSILSVPSDEKASVSGFVTDIGVEKIESLDDNLAMLTKISLDTPTDTSNFVSPIPPDDDMWQTIARESMSYWDSVAREADLPLKVETGLLKKGEIVFEHVTDSLQQDMLPDAVS